MMASGFASRATSGITSGIGLARPKMIGRSAIFATIPPSITPAAERPRNRSAPSITSPRPVPPAASASSRE